MHLTKLLPAAVREDKSRLPPQLLEELKPLKTRRPWRFLLELLGAWLVIFFVVALAVHLDHWLMTVTAILIVATRQNILGLLVHDQAHCTGFKPYPGDIIANLFAAYPLMVLTVEGYARVHLTHHAKYFTEQDPDHIRKSGEEWNYPMRTNQFLKILARDLLGLNIIKLIKGKQAVPKGRGFARQNRVPLWLRPAYYLLLATILTATGTWAIFLLYWVLPLITVFQIIVRWGAVCEHQYNRLDATVQETTPLITMRWWERLLLPNLNFSYHIYHHYFPGISFSRLPKVHDAFVRYGLVEEKAVFHGYWSYLKFILSPGADRDRSGST